MGVAQAWVVIGVPGLIVAAALFSGRSRRRAIVGYVLILALVGAFAVLPGGGVSAALIGGLGVTFVATGRGTHVDARYPEHHEQRRDYTVAREGGEEAAP